MAKRAFNDSEEVAIALNQLGRVFVEQGRLEEAQQKFNQVLKIVESRKDINRVHAAATLNNLAVVQRMIGNHSRAAALMREVVKVFETDPSANEEDLGIALTNLAVMLQATGEQEEAMAAAQRSVSILERGKDTDTFATSLVVLGHFELNAGDPVHAEATLQRALRRVENTAQQDSPAAALVLTHLGVVYSRMGRHLQAEPLFQRAIEMSRRLHGPEHPRLLDSMEAYAEFLRATKRKGEAKKLEAYIHEQQEKRRAQNPSVGNIIDVSSLLKQNH